MFRRGRSGQRREVGLQAILQVDCTCELNQTKPNLSLEGLKSWLASTNDEGLWGLKDPRGCLSVRRNTSRQKKNETLARSAGESGQSAPEA